MNIRVQMLIRLEILRLQNIIIKGQEPMHIRLINEEIAHLKLVRDKITNEIPLSGLDFEMLASLEADTRYA